MRGGKTSAVPSLGMQRQAYILAPYGFFFSVICFFFFFFSLEGKKSPTSLYDLRMILVC